MSKQQRTWKLKGSSHPFVPCMIESGPKITADETVTVVERRPDTEALFADALLEIADYGLGLPRHPSENDASEWMRTRAQGALKEAGRV